MDPAQWFNAAEAVLWLALGGACFWRAIRSRPGDPARPILAAAGGLFWLFAASDLAEIRTGAWWRPWWLLAWKAACVAGLLLAWRRWRRLRLKGDSPR